MAGVEGEGEEEDGDEGVRGHVSDALEDPGDIS